MKLVCQDADVEQLTDNCFLLLQEDQERVSVCCAVILSLNMVSTGSVLYYSELAFFFARKG